MAMNVGGFPSQRQRMNIWLIKSKIDDILNDFYVSLTYTDSKDIVLHGWSITNLGEELKTHPFIKSYKRIFDYSVYPHFSTFEITWTASMAVAISGIRIFSLNKNYKLNKLFGEVYIDYPLNQVTLSTKEDITIGNINLDLIDYV